MGETRGGRGRDGDRARRTSQYVQTPLVTSIASAAASGEIGVSGTPGRSSSGFTTEHVRNLAEVAGSPTLEACLRRAAAEQLREVLLSFGVASSVCREVRKAVGGRGGEERGTHDMTCHSR